MLRDWPFRLLLISLFLFFPPVGKEGGRGVERPSFPYEEIASYSYGEGVAFYLVSYATLPHSACLLESDFAWDSIPFYEEALRHFSEESPRFFQLLAATSLFAPSIFPPPYPY